MKQPATFRLLVAILSIQHLTPLFARFGHCYDTSDKSEVASSRRLEPAGSTCSTDDLNHSTLVECKLECAGMSQIDSSGSIWPTDPSQVIHVHSSRSGDRFVVDSLPNLNFKETELQKSFDINTTIYLDTSTIYQTIQGIGTTIDTGKFPLHRMHLTHSAPILRDLFANSPSGIQLSLLRLKVSEDFFLLNLDDVSKFINELDNVLAEKLAFQEQQAGVNGTTTNDNRKKLKVILDLADSRAKLDDSRNFDETLKVIATSLKSSRILECWAVSLNADWAHQLGSERANKVMGNIRQLFSINNTLGSTSSTASKAILRAIAKSEGEYPFRGLLMRSEHSSTYNVLDDFVRSLGSGGDGRRRALNIITIDRDQPMRADDYGDWQNAQNYAVEILKHFEHGSNGFIERSPATELLNDGGRDDDTRSRDCSIYSLRPSHGLHFRGPMFYAIGHFSRHVGPGSVRIGLKASTQPNMFAAHYQAFVTSRNEIVAIVLNDNEHLLPLRVAVDGVIAAYLQLKPKSFNTIVIKQQ